MEPPTSFIPIVLEREAEIEARVAAARDLAQAQVKAAREEATAAVAAAAANGRAQGEAEVARALEAQAAESAAQLEKAQQTVDQLMTQGKDSMATAVAAAVAIVTGNQP